MASVARAEVSSPSPANLGPIRGEGRTAQVLRVEAPADEVDLQKRAEHRDATGSAGFLVAALIALGLAALLAAVTR